MPIHCVSEDVAPLDMERLVRFLRNPVKAFFKDRLGVAFWSPEEEPGDTEAFSFDGLENYQLIQAQTQHWPAPPQCDAAQLQALVARRLDALQRAGDLPMAGLGALKKAELHAALTAMAGAWAAVGEEFAQAAPRIAVEHSHQGVLLRDWVDGVYRNDEGERTWVQLLPSKLLTGGKTPQPRLDKLLDPWLRTLLTTAIGQPVQGRVVGQDGVLHIQPMPQAEAQESLHTLCALWQQGQQAPLPLPLRTALALLDSHHAPDWAKAEAAYEGSDYDDSLAEVHELCLARTFADFAALCAARAPDGTGLAEMAPQVYGPLLQWASTCVSAQPHASEADAAAV